MEPDESQAVSHGAGPPKDAALAVKILLSLAEVDQEAIVRFYFKGQTAEQIEEALELDAGYLGQLKRLVQARFKQERGES